MRSPLPHPPRAVRSVRTGFTLVELMVSIAITMIILTVIHVLFNTVSQTVSLGGATSTMIGDTRGVSDQIDRDGASMIGPSAGGYLVIRIQNYPSVQVITPARLSMTNRNVQSDQLAFIGWRGTLEPICPGNTTSYSNSSTAPYVRLWYGHGMKTYPNGNDPASDLGSVPNEVASTWVLCRQALFLQGNTSLSPVYAHGAGPTATVSGPGIPGGPNADLRHAYSDVSSWTLENLTANLATGAFKLDDLTFIGSANGSPNRLRVNPVTSWTSFPTSAVAQAHPVFVANVSDFFVEWATGTNGVVATNSDGTVQWTHDPNGLDCTPTSNNWPYMLRLRWRMHDKRGKIAGPDPAAGNQVLSGRWFEQIIKVNRD
jgi:hypothetical protein